MINVSEWEERNRMKLSPMEFVLPLLTMIVLWVSSVSFYLDLIEPSFLTEISILIVCVWWFRLLTHVTAMMYLVSMIRPLLRLIDDCNSAAALLWTPEIRSLLSKRTLVHKIGYWHMVIATPIQVTLFFLSGSQVLAGVVLVLFVFCVSLKFLFVDPICATTRKIVLAPHILDWLEGSVV